MLYSIDCNYYRSFLRITYVLPIYDLGNAFNSNTVITVPQSQFPYTREVFDYRSINTQDNRR